MDQKNGNAFSVSETRSLPKKKGRRGAAAFRYLFK
jgi:hypothetical protein